MRKSAVFHDAAGSEAPQLPAELWEHVFWHLSVKDWACAAATCTAFWALQPYRAGMCRMCLDRACSSGAAGRLYLERRIGEEAIVFADIEVDCKGVAVGNFHARYSRSLPFEDPERSIGGELYLFLKDVVQTALAPARAPSQDASMEGHRDLMTVLPLFLGMYKMPFVWLDVVRKKRTG